MTPARRAFNNRGVQSVQKLIERDLIFIDTDVIRNRILAIKEHNVLLVLIKIVLSPAFLVLNIVKPGALMVELILVYHGQLAKRVYQTMLFNILLVAKVDNLIVVIARLCLDLLASRRRDEVPSQLLDDQRQMLLFFLLVVCDHLIV